MGQSHVVCSMKELKEHMKDYLYHLFHLWSNRHHHQGWVFDWYFFRSAQKNPLTPYWYEKKQISNLQESFNTDQILGGRKRLTFLLGVMLHFTGKMLIHLLNNCSSQQPIGAAFCFFPFVSVQSVKERVIRWDYSPWFIFHPALISLTTSLEELSSLIMAESPVRAFSK